MQGPVPNSQEQRAEHRQRAYLGGKLVYGDYFSLDCVVRDISSGGCKVQLPEGQAAPDKVFLVEMKSAIAYEAHVVWRRYPMIGLAFDHQFGLADAATRTCASSSNCGCRPASGGEGRLAFKPRSRT